MNMVRRSTVAGIALVSCAAIALSSCAAESGGSGSAEVSLPKANPKLEGTITLGAVLSLTGVSATVGKDQKRGIDLAVAQINADDGVLGKKLVVETQDSEGRAPAAIQAANRLVDVDDVPVLIGEYSSGNTIPMAQALANKNVVHINPGSSSTEVRDLGPHSFSVIGLDDVAGAATAERLHAEGYDSISMIAPNNAFGSGMVDSVTEAFEKLGGTVEVTELYTEGQADYRQELERLRDADADANVFTMYGKDGATINKEVYETGLSEGETFSIYPSMDIVDSDPVAVEGRVGLDVLAASSDGQGYADAYEKAYGEGFLTSFNSYSYDAVKLAAAAIEKAGSTKPADIQRALPQVAKGYDGVTGPLAMDADGQRIEQPYADVVVRDGELVEQ